MEHSNKRKRVELAKPDVITDPQKVFQCPICFSTIDDPHVTKCGHTFCHRCILMSLERSSRCPTCGVLVDQIFPNYLLSELIQKHQQRVQNDKDLGVVDNMSLIELRNHIETRAGELDSHGLAILIESLESKKKHFEQSSTYIQCKLLQEFLQKIQRHKRDQLEHLSKEVGLVSRDRTQVTRMMSSCSTVQSPGFLNTQPQCSKGGDIMHQEAPVMQIETDNEVGHDPIEDAGPASLNECSNSQTEEVGDDHLLSTVYQGKRRKMLANFDDLEQLYFNSRMRESQFPDAEQENFYESLNEFKETLNKFTMYSRFRPLASLCYTSDPFAGSSIVSSIEFDRDNELFAIAGVTKKIKLFDYRTVVKDVLGVMHYPVNEMVCSSKISCISWSSYYKSMMASSDYEGAVTVWDPFANQKIKQFQEHEKRCWSVDFNKLDTKLLSSGSDDCKVKLWSVNMPHSITSLEAKANVCCVKFNPTSRYHIAFGSADHFVHYYDLRHSKNPLMVFRGHAKAVSYVAFLNSEELVSASTDSQLRLWNTNKSACQRSFKGHLNEKNFVGLATNGEFLVCGSENNSMYSYYKGFSKPSLIYSFDSKEKEREKRDEDNDFLSAVCWKPGSNVVVAANSLGTIKVLELI